MVNFTNMSFKAWASCQLLVITGYPQSTSVKTESFDVVTLTTCQSLPAYPLAIGVATGAFVNSRVVICGGASFSATSQCYSIGKNETEWKLVGNMITPRYAAASVEINNKLVIFGGYDISTIFQSTEEIDVETGTATAGPNMPLAIWGHCAVKLNTTTVLIIGGRPDESGYLRSSYFYNAVLKTFEPGPLLNDKRAYHACSILNTGTEIFVVVAGGWNGAAGRLDSTEYMDVNQPTMWKTGL